MLHKVPANPVTPDSVAKPGTAEEPSFFSGHSLPASPNTLPRLKTHGFDSIYAMILMLVFILFVIVKVYSPRKLNQMFTAFIKPSAMNQLLREEYAFTNRSSLLLLILSLLVLPLFAYQACDYLSHSTFLYQFSKARSIHTYLYALVFLLGTYLVKIGTIRFLATTFSMKPAGSEYVYTVLLFGKVAGLIMFPLVLLIAFARQLNTGYAIYTGLFILAMLLIYRLLRLVQIGISTAKMPFIYLFLYLCTLELLPFIVFIKLFVFPLSA